MLSAMRSFQIWIMIVFVAAIIAMVTAYPLEIGNTPQQYDIDFFPGNNDNNVAAYMRMIKRDARAVKRERIIMDALGGDYLVKRSILY